MSIVASLVSGLTGPVATYLTRRAELKSQEHLNKLALTEAQGARVAELARQGMADDAAWELESLRQHGSGWKDEAVFIVLAAPYLAGFYPGAHPYIKAGWEALGYAPDWYKLLFPVICAAIYGIRLWRRNQSDT